MDTRQIRKQLFEMSTTGIVVYNERVTPNCKPVIGVKVPELRKFARNLAKEDYLSFLHECEPEYFEEEMLMAFVLGYAKDDIDVLLNEADSFMPRIHDWAVNDAFCQTFSVARKHAERVFEWQMKYARRDDEFSQRVAAVLLLSHFLTDEYIDRVLCEMEILKNEGYYTKMGVAWCIATAYAKFPLQTRAYLNNNTLDDWTYRKAIQKMIESYRVPEEDKPMLRSMKDRTIVAACK